MKPMKKIDTYIYKLGLWAGAALSLTACVDEDLSDCPPNVEMREITVSYQIDLQHGVDPEFEAELLSLHLGFWNSPQNLYRDLVFQPEDMPEELFFKVTLPVDNYDHLAVANHNNDRVGGGLHTFDNVLEDVVVDETPISPDTVKALDLSDCPPNVEMREITVSYQIDLQHGVDPEFEAELLSLHLGFWNSPQNLYRDLVFQPEDMPEELFFKVTLPVDNYDHLAVANHNNDRVGGGLHTFDNVLEDVVVDETPISPDTVKALAYPPFSGVLSMRMEEEKTEHYTVLMSPVVGKVKLHVNHPETMRNIKCYLSRTQQGFLCWEDAYISNDRLRTDASDFKVTEAARLTEFEFYSYPCTGGSVYRRAEGEGHWKLYFYSECEDRTIQHIFTVEDPIRAGRVLEATFNISDGSGEAVDVTAGVEINTDWKPGNDYDQEM